MEHHKYRVYVGPTLVKESADRLRAANLEVTCEGTQHVHVNASSQNAVLDLNVHVGSGWTWRDVQLVSTR